MSSRPSNPASRSAPIQADKVKNVKELRMRKSLPALAASVSIIIGLLACSSPLQATATPTPQSNNASPGSSGSAGSAGGGGGSGGGATPQPAPTITPTVTPTPTETPTPGPTPDTGGPPFIVKQTRSLGGEKIAGLVCKLTDPFVVTSTTPQVSFTFNFVPLSAARGSWTYAYNIDSAGETHAASGTYTITSSGSDGTLTLSMTGSDKVAFKGFSGPFPVRYSFDLVPAGSTSCP